MYPADPKPTRFHAPVRHYHRKDYSSSNNWNEWAGIQSDRAYFEAVMKGLQALAITGAFCALVALLICGLS